MQRKALTDVFGSLIGTRILCSYCWFCY